MTSKCYHKAMLTPGVISTWLTSQSGASDSGIVPLPSTKYIDLRGNSMMTLYDRVIMPA